MIKKEMKFDDIFPVLQNNFLVHKGSSYIKLDENLNELDKMRSFSSKYTSIYTSPNGRYFVCDLYMKKKLMVFDSESFTLVSEKSVPFEEYRAFILNNGQIFIVIDDSNKRLSTLYYFSDNQLIAHPLKLPFYPEIKAEYDGLYILPKNEKSDSYKIIKLTENLSVCEIILPPFEFRGIPLFFDDSFFAGTDVLFVPFRRSLFKRLLLKIDLSKKEVVKSTKIKGSDFRITADPMGRCFIREKWNSHCEIYSAESLVLLNKFRKKPGINMKFCFSNDGKTVVMMYGDTMQAFSYNEFQNLKFDF
ncbi:MAG: hypothetical protein ACI4XH_06680 [Acutalibacteraceae bacterium]